MLSSRGAVSTDGILAEVVDSRPPSLRRIVTLAEALKLWGATCKVLRAQLLQDHGISLPGRTCGFSFKSSVVVKDGDIKYSARSIRFGFHPAFITRFSLDTTVPRSDGRDEIKLPLEIIADECSVPVDFLAVFLHEVFLFIGEALFRGRLLRLEFDGVASILAKREKAIVSFDAGLLADLFAIDSRKWPQEIRQLARPAVLRHEGLGRPASASSRPPSSKPTPRPASAATEASERPDSSKVAFVSAAPSGKLFAEIAKVKPRRPPSSNKRQPTPNSGRRPLAAHPTNTPSQALPSSLADDDEEESVYSVLSPERRGLGGEPVTQEAYHPKQHSHVGFGDEDEFEEGPGMASRHVQFNLRSGGGTGNSAPAPPEDALQESTAMPYDEAGTSTSASPSCFYFGHTASDAKPEGKRRFAGHPNMAAIRSLLYGNN